MILCAECKLKGVYIEASGHPAEFCSNQCRKAAVEHGKVQGCVICHIYPRIRLPNGSRSSYCGRQCQSRATSPTTMGPPIPVSGGTLVPVRVPLCLYCQTKTCWQDPSTQAYLSFCGRTCKESFDAAVTTPPIPRQPFTTGRSQFPYGQTSSPQIPQIPGRPQIPQISQIPSQQPQLQIPGQPQIPQISQIPSQQPQIPSQQPQIPSQQPQIPSQPQILSQPQIPIQQQIQQTTTSSSSNVPQPDSDTPPKPAKPIKTKPKKNGRLSTLRTVNAISLSDENEPPPPYEPSDRFKNVSDRKITRDDNFDDENPYGFRDHIDNQSDES